MIDLEKRYARVEDGEIKEPYVLGLHIKNRGHEVLLYSEVIYKEKPAINQFQYLEERLTVVGRTVVASYVPVNKTGDQILAELHQAARNPDEPFDPLKQPDILLSDVDPVIVAKVLEHVKKMSSDRLDRFAQERDYDNIVSLATYAASTVSKFQLEGQRGVDLRDATFAALYTYLTEMTEGTAFVPKSLHEVESRLPVLIWE